MAAVSCEEEGRVPPAVGRAVPYPLCRYPLNQSPGNLLNVRAAGLGEDVLTEPFSGVCLRWTPPGVMG